MTTSEASTRERVVAMVAQILKVDPSKISGKDRLREDLGMDSLASLELLSCISDELDVDIELDEAMSLVTIDDACAFVDRVRAEQRGGAAS
ncbi:MAG: acyl carrier protein [Sorangiineae bacterium]|nr:acyl carrier protein [Polyangiaceae bacterium]MEB2320916.1 acyl carrier protein [Sorangiineae bacterium]